jgi:GDPmannose 4,6-dehydratase
LATGKSHSVRNFVEEAFKCVGIEIVWKGKGIDEIGYDKKTGRELIFIDSKYFRPAEVEQLLGNPTKAKTVLGWSPKITFEELVSRMMVADSKTHTSQDQSSLRFQDTIYY